jgi:hypothetical protein
LHSRFFEFLKQKFRVTHEQSEQNQKPCRQNDKSMKLARIL